MNQSILVIRFGSLGDVILASAACVNLKLNYPGSKITFYTKERFRSTVECFAAVDEVLTLPEHSSTYALFSLAMKIRLRKFGLIVDLHSNIRSRLTGSLASLMVGSATRIIYNKSRKDRMRTVTNKIFPSPIVHTIDRYNDCLRAIGNRIFCHRPLLSPPSLDQNRSKSINDAGCQWVLIAPGASYPTKQWPIEKFCETARILHHETGAGIIWAITEKESKAESPRANVAPDAFLELIDEPIPTLAAVLANVDLTIANDSGIAHLSSAVGTPVMAIFGPTHPALGFGPRGLRDEIIEVEVSCRPCSLHGNKACYREEQFCFTRIGADQVAEKGRQWLSTVRSLKPAAFVDRDGTIIIDKHFLSDPNQVEFEKGAIEGLQILDQLGFRIVIISNQSGVARGYFDTETVDRVNGRLLEMCTSEGIEVAGVYFCPHYPEGKVREHSMVCDCRKPAPAMVEQAAIELDIDLRRSVIIGDKMDDINLGLVTGCRSFLVRTGHGRNSEKSVGDSAASADLVFDTLADVARSLRSQVR